MQGYLVSAMAVGACVFIILWTLGIERMAREPKVTREARADKQPK